MKKDNPDLVVLDMKIPGMDGIEILKHVKEIDESIKVILMTAYGERYDPRSKRFRCFNAFC